MGSSRKIKIVVGGVFLFVFVSIVLAQETHNLEIIWQKTSPPDVWYFGSSLSAGDFNGDSFADIVIRGDSLHGDTWTHKAYIFFGGSQFDTIPDVVIVKGFIRLKGIGDINDDGFDDLALGSPNSPFGRVYIYLGGNPMDTISDFELKGPQDASAFGVAIGTGDVNGDSYDDLIVGAYTAFTRPGFYPGIVYVYFGGPGFDTIPDVILNGGHNNDLEGFGASVSGYGDVNKDGFSDIIVGANNFSSSRGRIYIFLGGNPMDTIYDVAMTGEGPYQSIGEADVDFLRNRIGYDYAVTGTPLFGRGSGGYNQGKVYVLFGGPDMDSVPDVWMLGRTDSSFLGVSSRSAGDLNGDTYDELGAGAPVEYNSKGTAYIWLGGTLLDTIPDAWLKGIIGGDGIGWHLALAGDVNGDDENEIMVSNSAGRNPRVWVCKYTGQGIEERQTQKAKRLTLEISPNPAKSVIRVRCPVTVKNMKIYDITGKIIRVLDVGKTLESGQYEIRWDLRDDNQKKVATGIYFIEIKIEEKMSEIRKITVVK